MTDSFNGSSEKLFHSVVCDVVSTKLPDVWNAYVETRAEMLSVFQGLLTTDDERWKSQVMALVELHDRTIAAAMRWDQAFLKVAEVYKTYEKTVDEDHWKELDDLLATYGTHTVDWHTFSLSEYLGDVGNLLVDKARKEIADQLDRIRRVAELTS